jgi:hypothetical protein
MGQKQQDSLSLSWHSPQKVAQGQLSKLRPIKIYRAAHTLGQNTLSYGGHQPQQRFLPGSLRKLYKKTGEYWKNFLAKN